MYYTHGYCIGVHHSQQEIFFRNREKFLGVYGSVGKCAENVEFSGPER